jgi:hypothetical protein
MTLVISTKSLFCTPTRLGGFHIKYLQYCVAFNPVWITLSQQSVYARAQGNQRDREEEKKGKDTYPFFLF